MTKQPSSKENLSEREVYIRPAKEANTDKIWRLQKCVYDLADASRYWYLPVKKESFRLDANISSTDPQIFLGKKTMY